MTTFDYKTYTMAYLIIALGLAILNNFISLPSGLATILPCMSAALYMGQKTAQRTALPIAKPDAWRFARVSTAIVIAINGVFLLGLLLLSPIADALASVPIGVIVAIFALLMLVVFLTNRFFVTFGANSVLKAHKK